MADQTLSLIIPDADEPVRGQGGEGSPLEVRTRAGAGSAQEVRGPRWDAVVARFNPRRHDVKLRDVHKDLVRIEGEVAELLADVGKQEPKGFTLSEIEVSLALSASGSIGIATAGVEAGIALTFSRSEKDI